ncbi:MAG: M1 family aminopeptidase [Myxococcota bacterium]
MVDVGSKRFVQLFQGAVDQHGRVSREALTDLQRATSSIANDAEKAAAQEILSLVKHDREMDSFEVDHIRVALGTLNGVSPNKLPKELEKVLRHGVPQSNVLARNYDLTFDFSKDTPAFPARAVVTLEKKASGKAILEVDPERLDISKVQVGGKDVPFEVKGTRLVVDAPGAKELDIRYTVKPQDVTPQNAASAYGLIRDKFSGRMWTLTWPYNTGALFPSNSAPADGSTSRVTVRVADGHQAVATGHQEGTSFHTHKEAPAYAIAMYTAKDFEHGHAGHSHGGVAVSGYGVGNSVAASTRNAYRNTARESLDFYSQWLGEFEYGKTLKLVEVSGGLGGMEHTAAVAIMMNAARDPKYSRETAAHEVAHHWFGDNLRIKTWGDFWMSEGFTNYATYRFFRHSEGEKRFHELMDNARDEVRSALADNPHALAAPAHVDVNEIFDSIPYEMGPWILRMLEVKLGTEKFDGLLRAWYQDHRHSAVSTEQFIAFVKDRTGSDLTKFFAQWNHITAVPSLKPSVDIHGEKVKLSLEPRNDIPDGVRIPAVLQGTGGESKTVMVEPGKTVDVDAGFPVKKVSWDPERTVLADVR